MDGKEVRRFSWLDSHWLDPVIAAAAVFATYGSAVLFQSLAPLVLVLSFPALVFLAVFHFTGQNFVYRQEGFTFFVAPILTFLQCGICSFLAHRRRKRNTLPWHLLTTFVLFMLLQLACAVSLFALLLLITM